MGKMEKLTVLSHAINPTSISLFLENTGDTHVDLTTAQFNIANRKNAISGTSMVNLQPKATCVAEFNIPRELINKQAVWKLAIQTATRKHDFTVNQ